MELFMLQYNVHVAVASRRDEKKMLAFIVLPSHDTLATEQARNDKKWHIKPHTIFYAILG